MKRAARDSWIGVAVSIGGLVAMYFDHVAYDVYDWAPFVLGAILILGLAAYVFGRLVRRIGGDRDAAGRAALVLGLVTIPAVVLTLWIGPPWVLAGGSIALGLDGLHGKHHRRAVAGLVLGLVALTACIAGSDWRDT